MRLPPRNTARNTAAITRLSVCLTAILVASDRCQVAIDPQPLQRFDTCDDLQVYLEDQILRPGAESSFQTGGAVVGCSEALTARPREADAVGEGEGERSFTKTNTQEAAVDEPDFVKNN